MKYNTSDRTYKQINDLIRCEMKRKKINQEDVAYRLNIPQTGVSKRLNGSIEWTMREIIIVYEMLGMEFEVKKETTW